MMQTYRHTYHICITRVNRTSVYGTLLVDGSLLSCSRASGIPFRPFATTATTNAPRAEGPKGHWSNVKSNAFIIIIYHSFGPFGHIWTNVFSFRIHFEFFIAVQTCASSAVGQLKYSMRMKRQLQLAVFLV